MLTLFSCGLRTVENDGGTLVDMVGAGTSADRVTAAEVIRKRFTVMGYACPVVDLDSMGGRLHIELPSLIHI